MKTGWGSLLPVLALPVLLTKVKLVAFVALGERSHQFAAETRQTKCSTKPMLAPSVRQVLIPLFVRLHEGLQKAELLLDQAHPLHDDVLLDGEHLVGGGYL